MPELTEEQAIALGESRFWEAMTPRERAVFQMNTERMCMPFDVFHKAVETTLGRPVWTHEFGLNFKGLKRELNGEQRAPTFAEITDMIPAEKRIIVVAGEASHV